MELIKYLQIIKKRMWLILLITIVATVASAVLSIFVLTPIYEAKSTLIISRAPSNLDEKVRYDDILMYEKLVTTYSQLAKSKSVIAETISKLGYDIKPADLQENLTITPKSGTQIMEIQVQDKVPQTALALANTLSETFIEKARTLMNSDDVRIMEMAELPVEPAKPVVIFNIAIAFFLGLMLSIALVFLLEYFDNTLKTENDIEKYLTVSVLASIPYEKTKKRNK